MTDTEEAKYNLPGAASDETMRFLWLILEKVNQLPDPNTEYQFALLEAQAALRSGRRSRKIIPNGFYQWAPELTSLVVCKTIADTHEFTPVFSSLVLTADSKNYLAGYTLKYRFSPLFCEMAAVEGHDWRNLWIESRLGSGYSERLFDLLMSNIVGDGLTISVEELRRWLEVPDGHLTRFADFNRRALQTAIKEINAKSELSVSVDYVKDGRAVSEVTFKVKDLSLQKKRKAAEAKRAAAEAKRAAAAAKEAEEIENALKSNPIYGTF